MFPRKLTSAGDQHMKSSLNRRAFQEFEISDTGYGKDHVKILHIRREGNVHHIKEFEVNTHLKLYSKKDYLQGNCRFFFSFSHQILCLTINFENDSHMVNELNAGLH